MTIEEAIRILDPETTVDALVEYEYYGGFSGRMAVIAAFDEACRVAVDALRELTNNEPLTLEELRKMDGEPVWIVEYPDWGHWELSECAEDYIQDRDDDFYGLKHEDPYGKYGLHVLGWLAYRRKPEEVTNSHGTCTDSHETHTPCESEKEAT